MVIVKKKKDPTDIKDFGKSGGGIGKEAAARLGARRRAEKDLKLTPEQAARQQASALAFENKQRVAFQNIIGAEQKKKVQVQQAAPAVTIQEQAAAQVGAQPTLKAEQDGLDNTAKFIAPLVPSNLRIGAITTAAQVIDAVTSTLSSRKQSDVIANEQSFNDASKILKEDIDAVKRGERAPYEAAKNIALAEQAILRLEGSAKGLGKLNLRYWLTEGKELETQILLEKRILESLKVDLANAQAQAQAIAIQSQQEQAVEEFGLQ